MPDARMTTIYKGTTGIQANDLIGRKVARDQAAAVKLLLTEMNVTLARLKAAGDKDLKIICRVVGGQHVGAGEVVGVRSLVQSPAAPCPYIATTEEV
jgi:hypothetical protein